MYNLGFNTAYARNISVGKASAKATNRYVEKKKIMKEEAKQGHHAKQLKCQLCPKICKTKSNLKRHTI